MKPIETAYINALLADASYITPAVNIDGDDMKKRMTATQSAFIAANFKVKASVETPNSINPLLGAGFDAVVWEDKAGTPHAGQIYVSMRGTQRAKDIADDLVLAGQGIPRDQIVSMVNSWMRLTTPEGSQARQIKWDPLHVPGNSTQVFPRFVEAPGVAAMGT